jgi:hypothetical protein
MPSLQALAGNKSMASTHLLPEYGFFDPSGIPN